MSDNETRIMLARFETPGALLEAAKKTYGAGFKLFDIHSPFPVHGMDQAMGLKRSPLGYIIGVMGAIGLISALGLQWWTSAIDYPLVISGKPFFSFQAFVPITFAITVLFSAFGAMFGMLALNKLPQFHHMLFNSKQFERVTDDGFFVSIESDDKKFSLDETRLFLESIGGTDIEIIEDER